MHEGQTSCCVHRDLQQRQCLPAQLFQFLRTLGRLRAVRIALAGLRGLYFEMADLLIEAVKKWIRRDGLQLQGQLRVLSLDFQQLLFQLFAIGQSQQAAADAGPVKQQTVGRLRIGQRLGVGNDKHAFELPAQWLASFSSDTQRQAGVRNVRVVLGSVRRIQHDLEQFEFRAIELVERVLKFNFGLQAVLVCLVKCVEATIESYQVQRARSVKQSGCSHVCSKLCGFQRLECVLKCLLKVTVQRLTQQCFEHRTLFAKRGLAQRQWNIRRQAIE
ncbi:hypothetical protein D9M71_412070 [compost metagenome]